MLTYQDYNQALYAGEVEAFLAEAIARHLTGGAYREALAADAYDRQRNLTVNNYTKFIAAHSENPLVDASAANNRIPSNFFHQLNVQRCAYLLGNGVSFTGDAKGALGARFDRDFYDLAYKALIHGESFALWSGGRLYVMPITQFVPFYDERTGALMAGGAVLAAGRPSAGACGALRAGRRSGIRGWGGLSRAEGHGAAAALPAQGHRDRRGGL